jgi:hypothetical protein
MRIMQSWLAYLEEHVPGIIEISSGALLALLLIILVRLLY